MTPPIEDARSDRELLDAVSAQDRGALRALHERHAPWLDIRLSRRCADPETVDQAVQDTFLAIWRKPGSYEARGDVAAWIWGIGIRRLIDLLRRRPALTWSPAQEQLVESAEEQVLVGIEHGHLAHALGELSPELRAVVQATVLDGLTTREASRLLGIPSGTVKTRMKRARAQLREALT